MTTSDDLDPSSPPPGKPGSIEPDVLATLAKLPFKCFASAPSSRGPRTVQVIRGVPGYVELNPDVHADNMNATLPVQPTPEQIDAMVYGAMYGWHHPRADPDVVRALITRWGDEGMWMIR